MALIQGKQIADSTITSAKILDGTIAAADVSTQILVASGANPLTGNLPAGGFGITGLADPSNPQDAATKNYVDATAQGLDIKQSVRVATAVALPANTRSANVITASTNGVLAAVDGITLIVGDRLLVKDEATQANNGIYTVTSVGSAGSQFTLTRATDADTSAKVTPGLFVFTEVGATNADNGFVLTSDAPVTINSTALVFAQFSGAGSIVAGAGLIKVGSTIDLVIESASGGLTANADNLQMNYALVGNLAAADAGAAAVGTSQLVARGDHKHIVSTAAPSIALTIGSSAAAGSATSLLRSDTTFTLTAPATPGAVSNVAAATGSSTAPARADHVHSVSSAAPIAGAVAVGNAAAAGSATTLALSDHTHTVAAAAPVDVGSANATGAATTFVRSDHVHRVPRGTTANKNMTASVTTADGDSATATTVANPSALGAYIDVFVNGVLYNVGDGTKVAVDCYFSGDGGTTARALSAVVAADTLRWNGTVAGFQLAATDRVSVLMDAF